MTDRFRMTGNVLLFPGDQQHVQHRVHGKMRLATDKPRCRVVGAAECGQSERTCMNPEFELLALTALEDIKVQYHVVE